ncbi:hypothetical protein WJT86_05375 [Microvirga sp. W0021]|uniref:Uncharacterized protein n=1 Tax=Hohaiivirga grylli TaxID=3133970 RepID=A0ABV0BHQ6_9HYPH
MITEFRDRPVGNIRISAGEHVINTTTHILGAALASSGVAYVPCLQSSGQCFTI